MRRTLKCLNETMTQLIDAVRAVQEDQSRMALIVDKLATKVPKIVKFYFHFNSYPIFYCALN